MDRYAEALADFDRAIELDEKYAQAIAKRGETYRQMGRYAEALADFTRAIELDEKYAWAIANRGITYRQMGRYAEALADFTCAIALDEKDARAFASRGETHRIMGDYEKALADFDRAIELDENLDYALAFRGDLHRRQHTYDSAIRDLSRAIELDPGQDSFPRSRRAAAYQALNDLAAANADIARVMDAPLKDGSVYYDRAVVCVLGGQHAEAIELLRDAIKRDSYMRIYAQNDDLLQPLRNIPEFQELILEKQP
jgi:tetratricopeptide (TPR) repeat protein